MSKRRRHSVIDFSKNSAFADYLRKKKEMGEEAFKAMLDESLIDVRAFLEGMDASLVIPEELKEVLRES